MKNFITIEDLKVSARIFCEEQSKMNHKELIGVTDGKAVGTYVEHRFQRYLKSQYEVEIGSSAKGIDLPEEDIQTDIKVTSITQPQSSCPFRNARQKIYGLGYNILVFVYDKKDTTTSCTLDFKYCTFIDKSRTADFTITKRLREMLDDGANKDDIIGFLIDKNVPVTCPRSILHRVVEKNHWFHSSSRGVGMCVNAERFPHFNAFSLYRPKYRFRSRRTIPQCAVRTFCVVFPHPTGQ